VLVHEAADLTLKALPEPIRHAERQGAAEDASAAGHAVEAAGKEPRSAVGVGAKAKLAVPTDWMGSGAASPRPFQGREDPALRAVRAHHHAGMVGDPPHLAIDLDHRTQRDWGVPPRSVDLPVHAGEACIPRVDEVVQMHTDVVEQLRRRESRAAQGRHPGDAHGVEVVIDVADGIAHKLAILTTQRLFDVLHLEAALPRLIDQLD